MKHRLLSLVTCAILTCHGSEKLFPATAQEIENQLAIINTASRCNGQELLSFVKQHVFLRAPRMIGSSVITTCIRNDGTRDTPYPTKEIEALLDLGVDIDQEGTDGRTALHEVAIGKSIFSELKLEGLLEHKADPTKRDSKGYNALGIALMSGRSDINILTLVGHPNVARVVNEPMLMHSQWTTPLNALITTPGCVWRKRNIKTILAAGAQITVQDICDSLELTRPYEILLKRSSLAQLIAAFPLVSQHKKELCRAIKEKIDTEFPDLAKPAGTPMVPTPGNKQPASHAAFVQPGYMRSIHTEYFKDRL